MQDERRKADRGGVEMGPGLRRGFVAAMAVVATTALLIAEPAYAGVTGRPLPATNIDPLPFYSTTLEVNDLGQALVETFASPTGPSGYLWTDGRLTPLTYHGLPIRPVALNLFGQVLGSVSDPASGLQQAVLWQRGNASVLPIPGDLVLPMDLNNRGQVAAISVTFTAPVPVRTYLSDTRTAQDLGVVPYLFNPNLKLNDAGQVAGNKVDYQGNYSPTGFLWTAGRVVDIGTLGGGSTEVSAVNVFGQVVGRSTLPSGTQHAFFWSGGKMTDLGTLGGTYSSATAVNDFGMVVGTSKMAGDQQSDAFVWSHGRITPLGIANQGASAEDVNDRGQVIASAGGSAGPTGAWVWRDGVFTALGTLDGTGGGGADINQWGTIGGSADDASGVFHATLWNAPE